MPITFQTKEYSDEEIFDQLNPILKKWFKQKFGSFCIPQKYGIMPIHQRKNILISAPTGSGKCITPDSTILIENDGNTKLISGKELIEMADNYKAIDIVGGRLSNPPGLKSYSLFNGSIRKTNALIYVEKYKGKIYKIKTEGGREIELSPDHPLLVEKDSPEWIPAKDIKIGDKIAAPLKINLPEKEIFLDYKKAIENLRGTADFVIDYSDFLRLRDKTNKFSEFSYLNTKELYEIKTLLKLSFADICKELGLKSLASAFKLFNSNKSKRNLYYLLKNKSKGIKFEENRIIVKNKGNQIFSFTYPKKVDISLARWLAFVMAEGIIGDYKPGTFLMVSQKSRMELLKEFFKETKVLFDLKFKQKNENDYAIYSTLFCHFITDLLEIKRGRGRYVSLPNWLLNAKKEIKSDFLNIFFSLEATIPFDGKEIMLVQSNQNKIETINYLLMSFGIFSSLGKKIRWATNTENKIKRLYYCLNIRGIKNLNFFINQIGINHQNRFKIEKRMLKKSSGNYFGKHKFDYKKISRLSKFYGDYNSFLKDLKNIHEVTRRTGYITEAALLKLKTKILQFENEPEIQNLLEEIKNLLDNNICWLKIKDIKIEDYEGKLVDLSVPDVHNFIGGYGSVYLHNTLTAFTSVLNYLINLAERNELENKIYAIYISPLKALAGDIEVNLKKPLEEMEKIAGKKFNINIAMRTGDTSTSDRQKMLKKSPHILITTPETLAITLNSIKFAEKFANLEFLIIDEIHALACNKRGVHLNLSVERLVNMSGIKPVRIGLSATIAPLEEIAAYLVGYEDNKQRECLITDVQFTKKIDLKVISPVGNLIDTTAVEQQHGLYNLLDKLIQEHKTTLIFTNTRSATERVINHLKEKFPTRYIDNIGAHHSSLSKELRFNIEERLRKGDLKVVVTSTSLELGIDIGYVDLVILLGSPKSVARALQRTGRAGHRLHEISEGRFVVLDRDDLVECSVILKEAKENKIDKIQIPRNCLDVLAQQIYGMAIERQQHIGDMIKLIRQSYCYHTLSTEDFYSVISYLAGEYALEARNVYAKIWYDTKTGMIGKRGKMARVIYMTNIGTIPEESFVNVVIATPSYLKDQRVGMIDEGFLERLKKGDVFVLGGQKYQYLYAKGMNIYVNASVQKSPTIPSWFSEMLPLSFDLAMAEQKFRKLVAEKLESKKSEKEIRNFISEYLYVEDTTAEAIYSYFYEQFRYSKIPHSSRLLIEQWNNGGKKYAIFHSLFGRRVNDALSRALAYAVARFGGRDVEIGINDNGFYLASQEPMQIERAIKELNSKNLYTILDDAVQKTEVFRRRFRHCATRALMLLRNYKGHRKSVGKQQMSSHFLLAAAQKTSSDFPVLREAKREIMEDLMDINNAKLVLDWIKEGKIKVEITGKELPSPFAFNLIIQGHADLLKIEDKIEFLKRMHKAVIDRIK